jgi:hypothetical protein
MNTVNVIQSTLPASRPLDAILLNEAWARVVNSQRLHQLGTVDSQLIIADDCGNLMQSEGDLSFLMPSEPVVGEAFHTQLNTDIQDAYRIRQKWTWDLLDETEKHPPLQIAGREVNFIPMFVNKETYTVAVFSEGA